MIDAGLLELQSDVIGWLTEALGREHVSRMNFWHRWTWRRCKTCCLLRDPIAASRGRERLALKRCASVLAAMRLDQEVWSRLSPFVRERIAGALDAVEREARA